MAKTKGGKVAASAAAARQMAAQQMAIQERQKARARAVTRVTVTSATKPGNPFSRPSH